MSSDYIFRTVSSFDTTLSGTSDASGHDDSDEPVSDDDENVESAESSDEQQLVSLIFNYDVV